MSSGRKYWEIIAERLHAQGWSYGISGQVTSLGLLYCVDAYRGDGKRYIVKADDILTAFLELEVVTGAERPASQWQSAARPPLTFGRSG